jgi:hypothetical protein
LLQHKVNFRLGQKHNRADAADADDDDDDADDERIHT